MDKLEGITQEQFDKTLNEILKSIPGNNLLAIVPGIYSEVSEYFNNEVLTRIMEDQCYDRDN